jgi:hypothetical protein
MDIDEYKDRIEKMHTITGVPSYWEQLQEMTKERDMWRELASGLCFSGWHREHCRSVSEEYLEDDDCTCGLDEWVDKYDAYAESKNYRSSHLWMEDGPERSVYNRFRRRTVIKLDNEQCQELSEDN